MIIYIHTIFINFAADQASKFFFQRLQKSKLNLKKKMLFDHLLRFITIILFFSHIFLLLFIHTYENLNLNFNLLVKNSLRNGKINGNLNEFFPRTQIFTIINGNVIIK